MYQNVRGLRTKLDDIYFETVETSSDIIILTETWLHPGINNREIFHTSYNVYRQDRDYLETGLMRGGGVLVAVRDSICSERVQVTAATSDSGFNDCVDYLWLKLRHYQQNKITLYLGAFYFQPKASASTYTQVGEMIMELVTQGNDVLIVGDFNIRQFKPNIDRNGVVRNARLNELLLIIDAAGLYSHNSILNHQDNTLDLVLSNLRSVVVEKGSSLTGKSDVYHSPLEITIPPVSRSNNRSNQHVSPQNGNDKQRLNFAKGDFLKLYGAIKSINWTPLYAESDVNIAGKILQEKMYNTVSQAVPTYKIKTKSQYPSWFTHGIIQTIRQKERVRRKCKKRNSEATQQHYRALRRQCKQMIREVHRRYTERIENRINEDPRSFWNFVTSKKKDNLNPSIYVHKHEELDEPQSVADAFADHFRSVFGEPASYPPSFHDVHSVHQTVTLHQVTADETEKALKHMNPKRAVGPDGVPQYIYKACSEFLAAPLTYVFNLAISASTFPHDWTITAITPIPKTTSTNDIADHRPITSMPVANKIFEKVLFRRLYPQIHNLIAEQQHGFTRNRTAETNLLEFTHYISETLDKKPKIKSM